MATGSWFSSNDVDVDDLGRIVSSGSFEAPSAIAGESGVPIFDGADLVLESFGGPLSTADRQLLGELATILADGPGILVVKGAVELEAVDIATDAFLVMIETERGSSRGKGDHFAVEGSNDRVWNVMEKLAVGWPDVFAEYYAAPVFDLISQAWLGPGYQITSQVNVVNPGSSSQAPHRDYHLGFMSDAEAERFPAHVHHLSPALTLQGAVAHDDMPIETGPTTYLPHSQKFGPGYVAWRRPDVQAFYQEHHVQLPLERGDAVFFNPAVLHGAGANRTRDRRRMANLLQISSPFGRAMEAMNRLDMCLSLMPVLTKWAAEGRAPDAIDRVISATAEGYSFPSDLDADQRQGGLAPPSQADILRNAIESEMPIDALDVLLRAKADAQGTARSAGTRSRAVG